MLISEFIYGLISIGVKIWSVNSEVNLLVPEGLSLSAKQEEFLRKNIDQIISCLESSGISSGDSAIILKTELERVPLSFAQQRLWFLTKYEDCTESYNIPMVFKVSEDINNEILKASIKNIVQRHEVLRTVIREDENGMGYQLVLPYFDDLLKIRQIFVSEKSMLDKAIVQEINYTYDLSNEIPIRVCLYEGKDGGESYLSILIHHIAFDGWSGEIFLNEITEYYRYYSNLSADIEENLHLPTLTIQYKDYAIWQKHYLSDARLDKQLGYWKSALNGYESLNLLTDKLRPKYIDYKGNTVYFEIEERLSKALRDLAKRIGVSLYSLLLAAYYLMLRVYSGQNDIVVGTPIANRHYPQIQPLIGLFLNTLALRMPIDLTKSILEFIQKVGKTVLEAQSHQDLPFEKLVDSLSVPKDTSRHPIFQVMFGLQSFGSLSEHQVLQSYVSDQGYYNIAKFDTETFIDDSDSSGVLKGGFNYAVSLYEEDTIRGFISTYKKILAEIAEALYDPHLRIQTLSYLTPEDYTKITQTWNQTDKPYPQSKTIHELFEEQVERTPDNIAVIYEDTKLTYRELNERANRLAHYLNSNYSITRDTLVPLLLDRNENMIISILAVLKAGGAYVPIDPSYPDERIRYIFEDVSIANRQLTRDKTKDTKVLVSTIVLTTDANSERLHKLAGAEGNNKQNPETLTKGSTISSSVSILSIDKLSLDQAGEDLQRISSNRERHDNRASTSLAYVIYTSGTTGNPKGVMVEHRGVVNYIENYGAYSHLSADDKVDVSSSIGFDFTLTTTVASLCKGATLIMYNNELQDIEKYKAYLIDRGVTLIKLVPSYFALLIDSLPETKVNKIILGGEKFDATLLNKLQRLYRDLGDKMHNISIYDEYGPTEATVGSCISIINPKYYSGSCSLNIGKPLNNYKAYVLLDAGNVNNNSSPVLTPLPIGAIGELYIGGAGLARGYLNRPDLTEERFLPNPFQTGEEKLDTEYGPNGRNARIYKTGDFVRLLPCGNMEYIGRNDFQVKIRGYRIELAEIEATLAAFPGINQCVVVARDHKIDSNNNQNEGRENSAKYLVAYYVSDSSYTLNTESIISYLSIMLPDYMIPSAFVHIEKLPLTVNSKIDRNALPELEFGDNQASYIAPRNDIEKILCKIWAEVLDIDLSIVGIKDDFFRLGGDSISSIQIVSRIRRQLGLGIVSIKDIFSYRTIERVFDNVIAQNVGGSSSVSPLKISTEQGVLVGEVLMLPIQKWFFDNNFRASHHWNQSFIIKTPELELDLLIVSIEKLLEHHDGFRLRYKRSSKKQNDAQGVYSQCYDNTIKAEELKVLDVRKLGFIEGSQEFVDALSSLLTDWQSHFDLERGPLHSIGYLYGFQDGSARIHFALHHLIVDGISWRILVEDLKTLYLQAKSRTAFDLGIKGSSYRQWADTIASYGSRLDKENREKSYWDNVLAEIHENTMNLEERVHSSEQSTSTISFALSKDATTQLLKKSGKTYNTEINDLLITALSNSLFDVTGNSVNYIILEGHGRQEEISYGKLDISRTLGWFTTMYPVRLEAFNELGNTIKYTKELLRRVPNKGIGFGAIVGYDPKTLPKISFNYLGQLDQGAYEDGEDDKPWSILSEISGTAVNPLNNDQNIININGFVLGHRLQFNVASKLDSDTTDKLANIFKERLGELINHTASQARTYLTVSDIENIISQEYLDILQKSREVDAVYLANSLQQGFIYNHLTQGNLDDSYIVQLIWEYNNHLDVDKLKEAWVFATRKYSSLRLRLDWREELVQVIDKHTKETLDWRYIDLSDDANDQSQRIAIKEIQEEDRQEKYKLDEGNLFRVYIIKQRDNLYTCILSNHHAILDGWSNPILLKYINDTYLSLSKGKIISDDEDRAYYETQKYLQTQEPNNKLYWEQYVSTIETKSNLSGLLRYYPQHTQLNHYKHIHQPLSETLHINGKLYMALKRLSQAHGITLHSILQYIWHKVLSIYGNSAQTVIGVTVSGRSLPVRDIENSVGLYINTIPVIVTHDDSSNLLDSIKRFQLDFNELNSRSNINLGDLHTRGERLFESLMVYENYPTPIDDKSDNKVKITFKATIEKVDYPLVAILHDKDDELSFNVHYAGELFSQGSVASVLITMQNLLEQLSLTSQNTLVNLTELNSEQYQLIQTYNQPDTPYPSNKTIHQLFEEQVERTPNNIAVVYEDNKLTYRELNERANRLANYLNSKYSITQDTLVPLLLDRSEHMIIAILAVLKAGGAYVPMDPSYPDERIRYILEDVIIANEQLSENKTRKTKKIVNTVVLTTENHSERLNDLILLKMVEGASSTIFPSMSSDASIFSIDNPSLQTAQEYIQNLSSDKESTLLNQKSTSTNLAYVIYTSGTTGNPKGVMVEHRGVVNLLVSMQNVYSKKQQKKLAAFTSYVFDVSVSEFFGLLIAGGSVYILSDSIRSDADAIGDYINSNLINYIYLPPALLAHLPRIEYKALEKIVYAGESCDVETGKYWSNYCHLYNYYGPTESTIYALGKQVKDGDVHLIGSSISNIKVYILSQALTPLPIGAIGELYIGGVGLARGYLNRPDLTEERFLPNPFQTEEEKLDTEYGPNGRNARIYKTGDLVRLLPCGNMEYIGRNDFQVKIRGYRVELAEIEAALASFSGVKQCVVVIREINSQQHLVGYYVSEFFVDEVQLKKYLEDTLPKYMVPGVIVKIESIPVNVNGKIDRNALLSVNFTKNTQSISIPTNEYEIKVREIWGQVLDIAPHLISTEGNFFDLGGNSLLLIKLRSRIEKHFGDKDLKVVDLFKYTTVKSLSHFLSQNSQVSAPKQATKAIDQYVKDDIAVIGMSGAFSGVSTIEEYWDNILQGKETLERLSKEQCKQTQIRSDLLERRGYIPVNGRIDNIYAFDPEFWGLSLNDAKLLDPQIRKFLEHCWNALENSGYISDRVSKNIGVFAGMSPSDARRNYTTGYGVNTWETQMMTGQDYLATRVSYLLGLTGPSLNINTACSTSLVAIVEACKNLVLGTCDIALSGGVCLGDPSEHGYIYQEGMIFSKSGHCRVFDEGADGVVPGMGVGVIVLKRLRDAERDGDNVIAVIKGYCSNNDGNNKIGFTAPSVYGQKECILSAQNGANITSDTISYIEAHGTGTALGDPIEIVALHEAFMDNSSNGTYDCFVGSVKANIGHVDSAAGVAGFIKVCNMLNHGIIPPQINFNKANPNLHLSDTYFKITKEKLLWERKNYARRAAVSSFGIGGTNAHIILEEYEAKFSARGNEHSKHVIIPISAKSHESYTKYCRALENYLQKNTDTNLEALGYSLQIRREHFKYRNCIVSKNISEALRNLRLISQTSNIIPDNMRLTLMFPGQGSQYLSMSRELYEQNPIFRHYFDLSCSFIDSLKGVSLKSVVFSEDDEFKELLHRTQWSQLALFVISFSLAKLLEYLGVNADYYIGHSLGEYVAATLSEVFDLEDVLRIIAKRGEIMEAMPDGKMLAIDMEIQSLLQILPATLEIAAYNSHMYQVVSGLESEIDDFLRVLESQNISCKKLYTSHAFHSKMMRPAFNIFKSYLRNFHFKKPKKPFISNVTGDFILDHQATSFEYWAEHMLLPVKFADGINTLRKRESEMVYIEVGVGNTLATFVNQHDDCKAVSTLPSVKESQTFSDLSMFHNAISKLWNYGVDISWEKVSSLFNHQSSVINDLPNYQFDTTYYQIERLNNYVATSNMQTNWMYSIGWQRIRGFGNKEIITLEEKKDTYLKKKPKKSLTLSTIEHQLLAFQSNNVKPIKTAIILQDDYGIADDLIRSIKKQAGEFITLIKDNELKDLVIEGSQIYINPYDEGHYVNLGNYLSENKIKISHIFHCWTVADRSSSIDNKLMQFVGMYSIYFLQNHILSKYDNNIYLSVLTNGISQVTGSDVIDCNKGLLIGALRALSCEVSNIKHLILDVGFDDYFQNDLLSFISNPDNYINEPRYAKRLSQLWKEVYTPLYLESSKSNIQDDDIILITGGLGGLGLAIAKEISIRWRVNFLLFTRNPIGSNLNSEYVRFQKEGIQFIQNNGCMVDIVECDITDAIKVSEHIATAKRKFGKIDGVIHAASSMALTVEERNIASMQERIKAKVEGAINLIDALKEEGLKFFVLTSSMDALVGGIGVFEYCAANSFLDTLSSVEDYPNLNLISINWPNWRNVGMNLKFHGHNTQVKPFALNEEEGAKIFYNLITQNHGLNQVAVSKIDINKLKPTEFHKFNQREIQKKEVNASTDVYGYLVDQETNELENKVAEVFCIILGHKSISKYQSFFALGGDSLKVIKLLAALNTKINSIITMFEFYANDKVEDLAKLIEQKRTSRTSPHYLYESEI